MNRPALTHVIVLGLLLAGCQQDHAGNKVQLPGQGQAAEIPPIEVSTAIATTVRLAAAVTASGTTQPFREANLGPQLSARIDKIFVHSGDVVKAGQVLVHLDVADAKVRSAQAEASAAAATVEAQLADSETKRLEPLAARGAVPSQKLDELRARRDALQKAAEAAGSAVDATKLGVSHATIRAPFAGTISTVISEVGEVATMMPPTVIMRLVDVSKLEVHVPIREQDLPRIALGNSVQVTFPSMQSVKPGLLTYISPEINPRTRSAEVVATIENADGSLRAGMFAELSITPNSARDALALPATAIGFAGDERYVYRVSGDTVQRQIVTVVPLDEARVEVIEGLSQGATVVSDHLAMLSDGAKVHVAIAKSAQLEAAAQQGAEEPSASPQPEGQATP